MPPTHPDYSRRYTLAEYFALEEVSDVRHEYYKGEIFPLDGPLSVEGRQGRSKRHNTLVGNLRRELENTLIARDQLATCRVYTENVRVAVNQGEYYTYPDLLATCEPSDIEEADALTVHHPSLIIEVLSAGTAERGWGWKMEQYLTLPSLRQYVMVEQRWPTVHSYVRSPNNAWHSELLRDLSAELILAPFDLRLPLAAIYRFLDFPPLKLWPDGPPPAG